MATVKFEYGKWNSVWGYQCYQCGRMYPFIDAAISHENDIEENNGVCPQIEKQQGEITS
jgi:hypothetical protein